MVENPPAFPLHPGICLDPTWAGSQGMTLRDWFAGQALCSIPLRSWDVETRGDQAVIEAWAKCAYDVADAMLLARATGVEPKGDAW